MNTKAFDKKWNRWLIILQAITYLWITLGIIILEHFSHFCEAVENNFIMSFTGAFAGGAALLLISYINNERQKLSKLNAAKSILAAHLNNSLSLQIQYIEKQCEELRINKGIFESNLIFKKLGFYGRFLQETGDYLMRIPAPSKNFLLNIEDISIWASTNTRLLTLIIKAKETIEFIGESIEYKNLLIERLESISDDNERMCRIYGVPFLKNKVSQVIDSKFKDNLAGLHSNLRASLFFLTEAIDELDNLSRDICPWWLQKKILRLLPLSKESQAYIPPKTDFKGY